jgi:heme-degrading monooxygenase HmoA
MIARSWHGRAPTNKARCVLSLFVAHRSCRLSGDAGNRGVYVFRRSEGAITHFVLTTFWESFDAVRAFVGADYERARYYPEDDEYLLEREAHATHYDVLAPFGYPVG